MDNVYRENILDHYRSPRNFGRLDSPDASYEEENITCGDRIGMEIKISAKGRSSFGRKNLIEIKFHGEGCAISMASSSLLTQRVIGMDIEQIKKMNKDDILKLLGIELTPSRLKCALLPLEALHKTLALVK